MAMPNDVVIEILSRLPVKSVLRFKCVCKFWCSTVEDPMFIVKHLKQSPRIVLYKKELDEKFTLIMEKHGLILERRRCDTTYRLRNPATRQILDLPDLILETKGVPTHMCYIPSTNEFKVVCRHTSIQQGKAVVTYNVLIVGTDFAWKSMVSPLLGVPAKSAWPEFQGIGTTFYNMRRSAGDRYIDCLDLENYSITSIKIPLNFLSDKEFVWIVNWEGKLSVAHIEQEQLNVHVLEDYKSRKWGDSEIVIPLTFLKDCPDSNKVVENITPYSIQGNLAYWRFYHRYRIFSFSFNTQSKEIKYLTSLSTKVVLKYRPSLIPLHSKVKPRTQESSLSKFCLCRA